MVDRPDRKRATNNKRETYSSTCICTSPLLEGQRVADARSCLPSSKDSVHSVFDLGNLKVKVPNFLLVYVFSQQHPASFSFLYKGTLTGLQCFHLVTFRYFICYITSHPLFRVWAIMSKQDDWPYFCWVPDFQSCFTYISTTITCAPCVRATGFMESPLPLHKSAQLGLEAGCWWFDTRVTHSHTLDILPWTREQRLPIIQRINDQIRSGERRSAMIGNQRCFLLCSSYQDIMLLNNWLAFEQQIKTKTFGSSKACGQSSFVKKLETRYFFCSKTFPNNSSMLEKGRHLMTLKLFTCVELQRKLRKRRKWLLLLASKNNARNEGNAR